MSKERVIAQGTMADAIRAFDWSTTPLGSIEGWSETLISSVNLLLNNPLPATLCWGEGLVFLYNDGAILTLAEKHPLALGQSYRDVFTEAWHLVGEDMEGGLHHGRAVVRENMMIPVHRDGRMEEHFWTYTLIPVYEGGQVVGVYNPYQNTTESFVAARERDAASAQLRQFMSATSDSVVGFDRKWEFSYLNPMAEKAYSKGRNLIGKYVWEEFPEVAYDGSPFVETYERAMYEGIAGSFEAHYPEPLNLWLQVEAYPTPDGIVTFSRDITEQKRAAASLLQTEKLAAAGRLAASIAHEINNPLESVTNLLYLARGSSELAEIQDYLSTAERELRRVSVISNQTLRFHKQTTEPQNVSFQELFDDVLSMYQGRLVNSKIKVEKREWAQRNVACFEGEIRQVLNNLVGNAVDAMHPQGGRLIVRSREGHNWKTGEAGIILTVADTGTGMSPQVKRKIFEAFYTTKGIGGTGLGLWVSKEILDRHHGTLQLRSCQSEANSGTVFSMFLPFEVRTR